MTCTFNHWRIQSVYKILGVLFLCSAFCIHENAHNCLATKLCFAKVKRPLKTTTYATTATCMLFTKYILWTCTLTLHNVYVEPYATHILAKQSVCIMNFHYSNLTLRYSTCFICVSDCPPKYYSIVGYPFILSTSYKIINAYKCITRNMVSGWDIYFP